jgi:hypothetical protein
MDNGHIPTQETHGCHKRRNGSVLEASTQQKHRRFFTVGLAVQISRGHGQEIEVAIIFEKFMAVVLGPKRGPKPLGQLPTASSSAFVSALAGSITAANRERSTVDGR